MCVFALHLVVICISFRLLQNGHSIILLSLPGSSGRFHGVLNDCLRTCFEAILCEISVARLFDPRMVQLDALNYASFNTILFQRLSVVILDVLYFIGVVLYEWEKKKSPFSFSLHRFCNAFYGSPTRQGKSGSPWSALALWLTFLHPGLLLVDRMKTTTTTKKLIISSFFTQTFTFNTTDSY